MTHLCEQGVDCWAAPAHSQDCAEFDPRDCHVERVLRAIACDDNINETFRGAIIKNQLPGMNEVED